MSVWDKLSALSVAFAAVVTPITVAFIGNEYSQALKERELQGKFVELSIEILKNEPSEKTENLRRWATQVIDKYSKVPFPETVREDLVKKVPIPSRLYGISESGKTEKINDLGEMLNSAIREKKNVVIFLHGRGNEREKVFEEISDDMKDYGIRFFMFQWISSTIAPLHHLRLRSLSKMLVSLCKI
jgi:hypothetical protein